MTDHRSRAPRLPAILAATLLAGGASCAALAQTAPGPLAQVTIEEALAGTVTIQARVSDVFGDRVLVEDASGRVLVETASAAERPASIEAGQVLRIDGLLRGRVIEARRITAVAGASPAQAGPAASPPPSPAPGADPLSEALMRPADPATMQASLEAAGFTAAGRPVRHDKETEISARDARGRAWVISFDRFGRIDEAELADYDDDSAPDRPGFDAAEVARIVEREGFRPRTAAERRSEHFEILALNRAGQLVELHVDFAGQIYKQEWIR